MADTLPDAPWATGGAALPDAPWATAPAQETTQSGLAGDITKSFATGLAKGIVGLPGIPGDIQKVGGSYNPFDWLSNKYQEAYPDQAAANRELASHLAGHISDIGEMKLPTSQDMQHQAEAVTGKFYEPQTGPGHYAQTAGEFIPNLAGGPEAIGTKLLTRVAAPAVASEAAGDLTHGTALEPWARAAGAIVGHAGANNIAKRAATEGPVIPTIEELHEAATDGYANARGYGVEIRRQPVARLADDIVSDLGSDGFRERNVPKTWSAIDELKSPAGRHVTIDDIESVRKALLRAGSNPLEGAEREASRRAVAAIDNYVKTLNPAEVAINPHYATDVAREISDARGNWAAMKGSGAIDDKIEAALDQAGSTYSGLNVGNATRQKFKTILNSPKLRRGLSDDEIDAMRRVVRGTYVGDVTRFVGKLLRGPIGLLAGHTAGGLPAMLGDLAVGHGLSKIEGDLTQRQARRVGEMVRARSPLGRSLPQPAAPAPVPLRPGTTAALGGSGAGDEAGQQRATGGAVAPTSLKTRTASHYSPTRGKPDHHCGPNGRWPEGSCAHYMKPNKCRLVAGFIAPSGGCDWFEKARTERAAGGRVEVANIHKAPSIAQKEAGNYAKDHIRIHGLDLTIENAKGAARSGVGRDGKSWSVAMPAHYGYIKRTEGADGDHVDVYLGPHTKSRKVFVVDQRDAESKEFDEHKCMIGFGTEQQARAAYCKGFSDGKGAARLGHMRAMSIEEFKDWLKYGDTKKPAKDA